VSLYRQDFDESQLIPPARRVLGWIREGCSEREAANRAEVSDTELRAWKRDSGYRAAVRRAKKENPPRCIDLNARAAELGIADAYGAPPPGTPEREIERQGWRRWFR
jgi:hypothetical protein